MLGKMGGAIDYWRGWTDVTYGLENQNINNDSHLLFVSITALILSMEQEKLDEK